MTTAMQMVLNQFIDDNASVSTMHEVMSDLHDVEVCQRVVNAYMNRGMYESARISHKHLEEAKEECSKTLQKAGIEYTIEDLLML